MAEYIDSVNEIRCAWDIDCYLHCILDFSGKLCTSESVFSNTI